MIAVTLVLVQKGHKITPTGCSSVLGYKLTGVVGLLLVHQFIGMGHVTKQFYCPVTPLSTISVSVACLCPTPCGCVSALTGSSVIVVVDPTIVAMIT